VAIVASVDGQQLGSGSVPTVCNGLPSTVQARVIDVTTGQPIKGYDVALSERSSASSSVTLRRAVTDVAGRISDTRVLAGATGYALTGATQSSFAPAATQGSLTPTICRPYIDSTSASTLHPAYGATVTVSGALRRAVAGTTVGMAAQSVSLMLLVPATPRSPAYTQTVATAITSTDVSTPGFTMRFGATQSGELMLIYRPSGGATSAIADLGALSIASQHSPAVLTATESTNDLGFGSQLLVSGRLTSAGAALSGAQVVVTDQPAAGAPITLGIATTTSDGGYQASVPVYVSGTVLATYTATDGTAVQAVAGRLTVGTWTTVVTLFASATTVPVEAPVTFTGWVSGTYKTSKGVPVGWTVTLYLTRPDGLVVPIGRGAIGLTGAFRITAVLPTSGPVFARATPSGYSAANSAPVTVTVR
jgi:hypothetical protein